MENKKPESIARKYSIAIKCKWCGDEISSQSNHVCKKNKDPVLNKFKQDRINRGKKLPSGKMSQKEYGDLLKVTQQTVDFWEKGHRFPSAQTLLLMRLTTEELIKIDKLPKVG